MKILSFYNFIKKPNTEELIINISIKEAVIKSLIIFGYILLFSIISGLVIQLPLKVLGLLPKHKMIEPTLKMFVTVALIAPISEELIFRGILRFNKYLFIISPTLFLFLLIKKNINIEYAFIWSSLSTLLLSIFVIKFKVKIKKIYNKYFVVIFYSSVLLFGLFHMSNFQNTNIVSFFIAPLLVINQLFMGLIFAYVRIKYKEGLIICILSHIILNTIFMLPLVLK